MSNPSLWELPRDLDTIEAYVDPSAPNLPELTEAEAIAWEPPPETTAVTAAVHAVRAGLSYGQIKDRFGNAAATMSTHARNALRYPEDVWEDVLYLRDEMRLSNAALIQFLRVWGPPSCAYVQFVVACCVLLGAPHRAPPKIPPAAFVEYAGGSGVNEVAERFGLRPHHLANALAARGLKRDRLAARQVGGRRKRLERLS